MKKIIVMLILSAMLLAGCNPGDVPSNNTADFSGGVFKGPFLVGSTVTIYPLDSDLNQTGVSYSGDIVSDDGSYDISGINVSGPIELVATGYYYDEITGSVTGNQMTMRAITEDTGVVNINLFTALEYDRVKALYNSGMSIRAAKAQAIGEIFSDFGLSLYQNDSGNISVSTANGSALLAVSSMFAYGRSPAQVQELITTLRSDFSDGVADVSSVTSAAKYINPSSVRNNLIGYYQGKGLPSVVPDFTAELYGLYGTDEITPDEGNNLSLVEKASPIGLDAGYGMIAGFIIPPGRTLGFRIIESDDWIRFYTGGGFTASADLNEATATGPGYFRLDNSVLYGPSGYSFQIAVVIDGVQTAVVDYFIR